MKRLAIAACLMVSALGSASSVFAVEAPSAVERDLPTVQEIFTKAAKAMGGREAIDKIKTMHAVFNMTMQGQDIEMDTSWSRKGGRLVAMKTPMGEMSMGTDGTTTWMKGPNGEYQFTPPGLKDQIKIAALLINVADPSTMDKKDIDGLKVVGVETFEGKECLKVYSPKDDADRSSFMFFDKDSGMPLGAMEEASKGTMVFGDWKTVGGVQFFHSMKMQGMGRDKQGNGEVKVTKLEINTPDEAAFALPEEVKKLVADKKPDAAAGPEIKLEDLAKEDQQQAKQMLESLSAMDAKTLKQMESSMGMGIEHVPPTKKKQMQFMLQEIRKEIKKRG